jgi:hypothetical protein
LDQRPIVPLDEETLGSIEVRHAFYIFIVDLDGPGATGLLIGLPDLDIAI